MSKLYMLDSDTSSYLIKATFPSLDAKIRKLSVIQICISSVTRAELKFGVCRLPGAVRLASDVERFLAGVISLPWDDAAADQFAITRAQLESEGTQIGLMDTMIAAHAMAVNAILVSNDLKHFRKVKGLRLENWLAPA